MINHMTQHFGRTETPPRNTETPMPSTPEPEPPLREITQDLEQLAQMAGQEASRPVQTVVRLVLAAVLLASGGGGTWLYSVEGRENDQNEKIEANAKAAKTNGTTIRRISVLLVQQGRHVEDMVRDVADGKPIRERPRELDTIERQILAERDD